MKEHKKKTKFQDHLDIFLQGLSMNEYAPIFKENAIDFKDLLILNDEDLVRIGITKYGHRKKILSAIHSTHTQNWESESLMDPSSQTYLS